MWVPEGAIVFRQDRSVHATFFWNYCCTTSQRGQWEIFVVPIKLHQKHHLTGEYRSYEESRNWLCECQRWQECSVGIALCMQHSFETIAAPPAKEANEKFLSYPSSCIKSTIWLAKIVPMKNRVTGCVSARGGRGFRLVSQCAYDILLKTVAAPPAKEANEKFLLYPSSCIKSTIWLAKIVPMKNRVTGCVTARGGYSVP